MSIMNGHREDSNFISLLYLPKIKKKKEIRKELESAERTRGAGTQRKQSSAEGTRRAWLGRQGIR